MGAHSTLTITRDEAMRKIYAHIDEASDEKIGDILDILLYESGYNYAIVADE